jgi:hypothetical protein
MWVAGADAGPPRFGPQAIAVLQHPPRLATVDLPPAAARQAVEAIAGEWRARFRELLEEPLSEAEAA